MNEEKITREIYIIKKLSSEIGELKERIASLEFSILLQKEEKDELEKKIQEYENERNK